MVRTKPFIAGISNIIAFIIFITFEAYFISNFVARPFNNSCGINLHTLDVKDWC